MRDKFRATSQRLLPPARRSITTDVALLTLRLGFGGMMMTHGWGKIANFDVYSGKFMNFMGIGPTASLALAIFAEFFCAALLIPGLLTRFAAANLAFTMCVAAFFVHASDPFEKKEMALLYLAGYLVILLAGPGRIAADHWLFGRGDERS